MIELTDEMRRRLATALADGWPVVAASVHPDGRPKLSFYGSTQVHDPETLAIWVRDPEAGLLQRIATNPHLAFIYRNGTERIFWQFEGRAAVSDDPAVRDAVYQASPAPERDRDPDQKGVPVLVTIDRVTGRDVSMERETV
jgi:predicted pyridoxine 5'-phosphate oxidase superfamily flavin-nucleotide-binding protein